MADVTIDRVLTKSENGRGRRSKLYVWFKQNFTRLNTAFEDRGPNWPELTAALAEEGIVDFTGKAATIRCAQQTWYRVKRDMARIPIPGRRAENTQEMFSASRPAMQAAAGMAAVPIAASSDRPRPFIPAIPARSINGTIKN